MSHNEWPKKYLSLLLSPSDFIRMFLLIQKIGLDSVGFPTHVAVKKLKKFVKINRQIQFKPYGPGFIDFQNNSEPLKSFSCHS